MLRRPCRSGDLWTRGSLTRNRRTWRLQGRHFSPSPFFVLLSPDISFSVSVFLFPCHLFFSTLCNYIFLNYSSSVLLQIFLCLLIIYYICTVYCTLDSVQSIEEGKAKVVTAVWGDRIYFAALTILHQDDQKKEDALHQDDIKKRMNSSYSSNRPGSKQLARQEI